MHIAIFCEQHPLTLGGAQMSTMLQVKYLKRAGHAVSLISPAQRSGPEGDPDFIDLPSFPVPTVKQYTWLWPSSRHMRIIEQRLAQRPPVDVVHVQSDFWGADFGYRYAADHGIPVVHTMHHRLDVGVDESVPVPGLLYALLARWQRWSLRNRAIRRPRTAFEYLAEFASHADVVVAPSKHFAELLAVKGVVTKSGTDAVVIPTGIDDDVARSIRHSGHDPENDYVPRLVWVGRCTTEKRLLEFCEALTLVQSPIEVTIVGDGALREAAEGTAPRFVKFTGALKYESTLKVIADADFLIQTSNGYETQGMTVYEALALGTHVIVVDKAIASELPEDSHSVTRDLSAQSLADTIEAKIEGFHAQMRIWETTKRISHLDEFAQSARTAEMIQIYASLS